jgi:hypothetical protein
MYLVIWEVMLTLRTYNPAVSRNRCDAVPMAVSRLSTVPVLCVSAPDGQQPAAPPRELPSHRKVPRRTPARRALTASMTAYCIPQHPLPSSSTHLRPVVTVMACVCVPMLDMEVKLHSSQILTATFTVTPLYLQGKQEISIG